MTAGPKLAAFVAALAATFGAALAVGAAVGPIDTGGDQSHHAAEAAETGADASSGAAGGLSIAAEGYRLDWGFASVPAATPSTVTFRIVGPDGRAVTSFDTLHERQMHLIVVSRNLVDYLHLHPILGSGDAAGEWRVDLPPLAPGSYRVDADFQPTGGPNLTLATDVVVEGPLTASELPAPSAVITVDGYDVRLDGAAVAGTARLAFTVELEGRTVATEPYLGAGGHLVALRVGDLAYVHVHPHEEPGRAAPEAGAVVFDVELPTAGTYRLFFEFAHEGIIRTAAFTVEVLHAVDGDVPHPTGTADDSHGGH